MFFQISKAVHNNFPYNHKSKEFIVSLDEGWSRVIDENNNDIWYKGYLNDGILARRVVELASEDEPTVLGNFCIIKVYDNGVAIKTDKFRSFPIWYNNGLTNLTQSKTTMWTDSTVTLLNDMTVQESKFDVIGKIDDTMLTLEEVLTNVDAIMRTKVQEFLAHNTKPLKVFLSGGIDTTMLFSYIKQYTNDYEIVMAQHVDFDYFYLKNHDTLQTMWGYTQIHHWKESCVLASGAPGDEYTVRSPVTANLMLLHYDTSIPELLTNPKYKDCLHYSYYNQKKYLTAWYDQEKAYKHLSLSDTIRMCCDYNANDWQHWHLGNTLTWTPYRDLELFKTIARLSKDDLEQQIMDSVIQRELIKRNDAALLNVLSPQKNSLNYLQNLTNLKA